MKLIPKLIQDWPKLAWVARFAAGTETIDVCHGPMVEVSDQWVVEAVWAGDFKDGDFDRTDLVFGTGVRLRGDKVTFVTCGTVFDRLWYCRHDGTWYVSNSLPALLAMAGLSLRDDYKDYSMDVRSISRGLEKRVRSIPTQSVDVTAVYYNNLVFDGEGLKEEPKPDVAPNFKTFDDYYSYLVEVAATLGENMRCSERSHRIIPLSGISSGYDSCATTVISRYAGCDQTVTIKRSTSLWRGSDSGAPVAKYLNMFCMEYDRNAKTYPMEHALWAAEGRAGILNWTLFDYPEPLCLFFSGWHGEKMWDRVTHDNPDPFIRRDPASLGFCEFRLLKGVFQCTVPFWGARHSHELKAITLSEEMHPWYMNKDYDKPIARRIVEQAGVPRRLFGTLNKNTSLEQPFRWPFSRDARESFGRYLKERGMYAPPPWLLWLIRRASVIDILFYQNVTRRLGLKKGRRPWDRITGTSLLFQWANSELKKMYEKGLISAGAGVSEGKESDSA